MNSPGQSIENIQGQDIHTKNLHGDDDAGGDVGSRYGSTDGDDYTCSVDGILGRIDAVTDHPDDRDDFEDFARFFAYCV